jgi:hypothetical protein
VFPYAGQQAELERPWPVPVTIIQPTVSVRPPFEVSPGTIAIDHAYGWMRAWDTIEADDLAAAVATSYAVSNARLAAWTLEERLVDYVRWADATDDPRDRWQPSAEQIVADLRAA